MNRIALFGLSALAIVVVGGTGNAAVFPSFPSFITTGPQSFTIDPVTAPQFSVDSHRLGFQQVDVAVANPGSAINATLTFSGSPFKVKYEVQGFGSELIFGDTVTVEASARLNGALLGSKETFNIVLSDQCGGTDQNAVVSDCSTKALLTAFDASQPIVIPAGTPASDVQFTYDVLQSNEFCVAKIFSGGVFQSQGACLQGGTSILDTNNLFDPKWSADIAVPEPGSIGLLVVGIAGVFGFGVRRCRKAA